MGLDDEIIGIGLRGLDLGFEKSMEFARRQLEALQEEADKTEDHLTRMTRTATQATMAVGGIVTGAALGAMQRMGEYAERLYNTFQKNLPVLVKTVQTANKLGVSASLIEGLNHGAKQAGVAGKLYEGAISGIAVTLGKAEAGNNKAIKSFNTIGLSWKKLKELSPEDRLKAVADAIKNMPDENQMAGIAGIVGGGGPGATAKASALRSLFRDGAAGIDEMVEKAEKYGVAWDEAIEKQIMKANEAKITMEESFESVSLQLTASLAPAMTEIMEHFTALIDKVSESGAIELWSESLGAALKTAAGYAESLANFVTKTITGMDTLQKTSMDKKLDSMSDAEFSRLKKEYKTARAGNKEFNFDGAQVRSDRQGWITRYSKRQDDDMAITFEAAMAKRQDKINNAFIRKHEDLGLSGKTPEEIAKDRGEHKPGNASGKEAVPKEEKERARLALKAQKEKERDEKKVLRDQERANKEYTRDLITFRKREAAAQDKVIKMQEKREEFEKDKANRKQTMDRTFTANERGTVEAFRAAHGSDKADQTALQQLEQEKKIHLEEVKANDHLAAIRTAIVTRPTTTLQPLGL